MSHFFRQTPISPREHDLLQLLAAGKTTKEAVALLGVTDGNARVILTRLRSKTAINPKDPESCKAVLSECTGTAPAKCGLNSHRITPMQRACLIELRKHKLYHEIATSLGINYLTARAHVTEGLKRLGLSALHGEELRAALDQHFVPAPVTMDDPFFN